MVSESSTQTPEKANKSGNKKATNVVTPPSVSEISSTEGSIAEMDFLCTFLKVSTDSDANALCDFLVFMGCDTLEDIACIEQQDFDSYEKPLSRVIQRKLLLIAEFMKKGGDLLKVASIAELRASPIMNSSDMSNAAEDTTHTPESTTPSQPTIDEAIIHLNVGGFKFVTTKDTLCRVPGSVLEAMFSGRHSSPARRDKDGSYFIDRNGTQFRYILDFLRVGAVVSLPRDVDAKENLVMEADYYGLRDFARAIRLPLVDTSQHLSEQVLAMRQEEDTLRHAFMNGAAKNYPPHRGLLKLFCPVEGVQPLPVRYEPVQHGDDLLMGSLRENPSPGTPVTTASLDEFLSNFNREHPNLLHRLSDILLEEPVVIAGGAVLRALTSSRKIRTAAWWGDKSDVDLFVHTDSPEDATRIARRIFFSLAVENERWAIVRSRGVITMHNWVNEEVDLKVQIVLRLYDSPAEVLLGFDCDCCCCLYDGRSVWLTARCLRALRTGGNILNSLHSWPNKPSYELRLAKYAFRGFPVVAPGLDPKLIDYDKIRGTNLRELKGMARLLKISFEMDASPIERLAGRDNNRRVVTDPFPSQPLGVKGLSCHARDDLNDADFTTRGMGSGYDTGFERSAIIVPECYGGGTFRSDFTWWWGEFPLAARGAEDAWNDIVDASNVSDAPEDVPTLLVNAWDTEKRSREYLNATMDASDLDNVYYGHAYKNVDA